MPTVAVADPVRSLKLTDGERNFYNREGYLQIPGLLPLDVAESLREEVMHIMNTIGGFEGNKLKQTNEYLEGSLIDQYVHSENLRNVATQLMGGEALLYLPFTAVKGSGGGMFHFHQDNNYTHLDGPSVNLWMALTDMTPENGCLMVVPRSHTQGTLESSNSPDGDQHQMLSVKEEDFLPIRMRPGDVVAFTRLTIHGSGGNSTPDPRVAYAIQYGRNDVNWKARGTDKWAPLATTPRWPDALKPVQKLTVPKGKIDGH
jgi:2-oxoglutarate-dependent dioxygenase